MFRRAFLSAATVLTLVFGGISPVQAQEYDSISSVIDVSFLHGWRHEAGAHYAGLKIELAPGWKTYWRAPGDGGLPTLMSWAGSKNLSKAEIIWPRPMVFRQAGMRSIGYDTALVLPIRFTPETPGAIKANLRLRMGVCKEVCLPVDLTLSANLTKGPTQGVPLIRTAIASQAKRIDAALTCRLTRKEGEYYLTVSAKVPALEGRSEASVIELEDPTIWISEPDFARNGDQVTASARLSTQAKSSTIDLGSLRFTLLTTRSAVEMRGCG